MAPDLAQPIGKLWSDWPIVENVIENRESSSKEVFLGEKYNGRFFDIRFYSLTGVTSRLGSRLIVMRDVTERRIMEDENVRPDVITPNLFKASLTIEEEMRH